MTENHPTVLRVQARMRELGMSGEIHHLSDSARSAPEAADALGILVGQVASSIVFRLPNELPLLVITSGRHRVDTELVAKNLGIEKLHRADADFVKNVSGFSIGGVPPIVSATCNYAVQSYRISRSGSISKVNKLPKVQ